METNGPDTRGNEKCTVLFGIDFDGASHEVGRGVPPIGEQSWGRYSARCGVPRYLDMLDDLDIRVTFFIPGYDAERHPDLVAEIARRGHEVAAHGYLHEAWDLSVDEESELLERTDKILTDILGEPVLGWRSPSGRKTSNTLAKLKDLGYIYDSSEKDADAPYVITDQAGGSMLEIPNNTYSLDDFPFYKFSYTPPSEVRDQWRYELDTSVAGSGYFLLTIHPRGGWGSGTPSRANIIRDLFTYAKESDKVRFMRMKDYAQQHRVAVD